MSTPQKNSTICFPSRISVLRATKLGLTGFNHFISDSMMEIWCPKWAGHLMSKLVQLKRSILENQNLASLQCHILDPNNNWPHRLKASLGLFQMPRNGCYWTFPSSNLPQLGHMWLCHGHTFVFRLGCKDHRMLLASEGEGNHRHRLCIFYVLTIW